jgi:hypothetical protein
VYGSETVSAASTVAPYQVGELVTSWSPYLPDGRLRRSWHVISLFSECPRLFKHAVVDNLVPLRYNDALARGSCVHEGLAVYYRALKDDVPAIDAERMALQVVEDYPGVTEEDRDTAWRVLSGYFQWYSPDEPEFRVLEVERDFEVDLKPLLTKGRNGLIILYHAKLDLIIEVLRGRKAGVWVVEHKTMRGLYSSTFESYEMDGQFLGEYATARLAGLQPRGVVLNVLTTAQTPKFDRAWLTFEDHEIRDWADSVRYWEQRIFRAMREGGPWPRNYSRCVGRYLCRYRDLCRYGEGILHKYAKRDEITDADLVPDLNFGSICEV